MKLLVLSVFSAKQSIGVRTPQSGCSKRFRGNGRELKFTTQTKLKFVIQNMFNQPVFTAVSIHREYGEVNLPLGISRLLDYFALLT